MSWITLTPADLEQYLAAQQVKALQTRALGSAQSDPIPLFIAEAATRVRHAIAAGGLALQASEGSVPPSLKPTVAALALEQAQTRLPGLALTREQLAQASQARGLLLQLQQRKLPLEAPAEPTIMLNAPVAAIRVVKSRCGKTDGSALNNL